MDRTLHKVMLICLKFIPNILLIIYLVGTILSCFGIDAVCLSYIGFTSVIPNIFMIMTSVTFQFCI